MTESVGYVDPERAAYREFRDLPRGAPIDMLNLIRLRDWAAYGDDRRVSGRDAYSAYSEGSKPIFLRVGASQSWLGSFECMLIGPRDEAWDIAFIARYPSAAAFLEMLADPDYQQAVKHRTAAVLNSRLVRFAVRTPGLGFGEAQPDDGVGY